MTVVDIADKYGVTTRTVYRRLIKNGLNIDDLRDESGKLSDDAVKQIDELFSANVTVQRDAISVAESPTKRDVVRRDVSVSRAQITEDLRKALADSEARTTAAEAEARQLSARVDDLTRQLSEMRATLDDVRADRDEWRRAASETRALQLQQMRLLPERASIAERVKGWFTRTKKQEDN